MGVQVFCLGPVGVGKSTLLQELSIKKDERVEDDELDPLATQPQPTVGVNHFTVDARLAAEKMNDIVSNKRKKRRCCFGARKSNVVAVGPNVLEVRELGGALAQNWTSYLRAASDSTSLETHLLFLVPAADFSQVPEVNESLVQCLETVAQFTCKPKVLLVYSKSDRFNSEREKVLALRKLRSLLRVESLSSWYEDRLELSEVVYSDVSGKGVPEIKNWMRSLTEEEGFY